MGNTGAIHIGIHQTNFTTGSFNAHGKLWDGDRIILDSLRVAKPLLEAGAGPQAWNLNISPSYSIRASRSTPHDVLVAQKDYQLSASADFAFSRNWKISWSGRYDFNADEMVQNNVNFECDLECWSMRLNWRPEKLNPGYYFLINVKKIPEIKWEQREN